MTTHFFGDTAVLTGRSIRHITRSPDTIITTAIMPVAMLLLFVYVFGGAIRHGPGSYVTYLLPGILLITIASGISYTALRLFTDMQSGIFQRFQSLPIARSAVRRASARYAGTESGATSPSASRCFASVPTSPREMGPVRAARSVGCRS